MEKLDQLRVDQLQVDEDPLGVWLVLRVPLEHEPRFSQSLRHAVEDAGAACRIVRKRFVSVSEAAKEYPAIVVVQLSFPRWRGRQVANAITRMEPGSGVVVLQKVDDQDFALELIRAGTRLKFKKASLPDNADFLPSAATS